MRQSKILEHFKSFTMRALLIPRLPPHGRAQRIGLLGGSFHPAHQGHRHISLMALRTLKLDTIWWLVTPGNPLKDNRFLENLETRMAQAQHVADHPAIRISDIEARLGTTYTADTLSRLTQRWPQVRFFWLMGADNLCQFHRWSAWRKIARLMPIVVLDRPGFLHKAVRSKAATTLGALHGPPVRRTVSKPRLFLLHGRCSPLSSTQIRSKPIVASVRSKKALSSTVTSVLRDQQEPEQQK
jgi:nicotinate-nucleotide adenylyltransferase